MTPSEQTVENNANDWTSAWFDFVRRMAAAGFSVTPDINSPPAAAKQVRNAFLQAMSASCDDYLRSPEFLRMMKASMDNAITFRAQLNEWLARAYREANLPAREDVEVLASRLQSVEKEILARVDVLEEKLTAILERLPAPDSAVRSDEAAAQRANRPRAASARRKRR
jgi:hypothetical protein